MKPTRSTRWPLHATAMPLLLCWHLLIVNAALAAPPPVITVQPTNQTVLVGGTATFVVQVTSGTTLSYQWYFQTAPIAGATNNIYTRINAQLTHAGAYYAAVQNAGGTINSSNAILTVLTHNAPILDASKSPTLAAESESAGAPSGAVGTLVSALVDFASPSGQVDNVIDPDSGALLGIAVTGANTAHGLWWYSTNNGVAWNALGAVSDSSSRLLAADANTRLYFQPDANYSGTMTNAITFRAWDQSAGLNGATADLQTTETVRDNFSTVAYANNDGTATWSSNWVDIDGSAGAGNIRIKIQASSVLELKVNNDTDWIHRQANLLGATRATLTFDCLSDLNEGAGGLVYLQVSTNGGASYTTLATFSQTLNTGTGSISADLSAYAATNTRVRFVIVQASVPTKRLQIDNCQIAYVTLLTGETTSVSTASDTASLTVNAVNDPPVAFSQSVSTPATTAKAITLTGSDVDNDPLTFAIVIPPASGVLDGFNPNTGALTYTPAGSFSGPDSFTFLVHDGTASSTPATVSITVTPQADVAATVTGPGSILAATDFSYFLTLTNAGPSAAAHVVVSDALPAGATFLSASDGGTHNAGVVTWPTLASLASGAAAHFTVRVTAPAGGRLTNLVTSTSATTDLAPSNNDGTAAAARAVTLVFPPALLTGRLLPGGAFQLELDTLPDTTCTFLASTNLVDWVTLVTTNSDRGHVVFIDEDLPIYPQRFYRSSQAP